MHPPSLQRHSNNGYFGSFRPCFPDWLLGTPGAPSAPLPEQVPLAGDFASSDKLPFWKHIFDLVWISLTWFLWFPVMLLVMVAIKLLSPGPVFYRQARVGYRGQVFLIYKFRSMKVNVETRSHEAHLERLMSEGQPMTKLDAAGDSRLIPLGRILRASGLDELPQIFNVLRGEMSLVGPRPCTVSEFQRYQPWQQERLAALPGLTGLWQVNGKNRTTFNEMIALDIDYAKNLSLVRDLAIMAKTLPIVLCQLSEIWRPWH